ncbi:MAG: OsmC family protein [Candidatus Bathyarchaeia archaeon]
MGMEIIHLDGWRFKAECRSHHVFSDQPIEEDGGDTAMTPVELFIASIGFCIGVYAKLFCDRHKIPSEGMAVHIEWEMAESPNRVGQVKVEIKFAGEIDLTSANSILRFVRHCTIHNTLTNPPKIDVMLSPSTQKNSDDIFI